MATLLLFSRSVMSDFLQPHELQQARLPRPSLSPGVCSTSCPLSHPAILSSIAPFSSSFNLSQYQGIFPMSYLFELGGQRIGVSASASVLPVNIQDWFPLGLTGWISFSSRDSQESSPTPQFKSINSSKLCIHQSSNPHPLILSENCLLWFLFFTLVNLKIHKSFICPLPVFRLYTQLTPWKYVPNVHL